MLKLSRLLFTAFLFKTPLFSQQALPAPVAQSADVQYDQKMDPEAKDMDALQRWLRDKRLVSVKEIGGDLSLSGEVRTELQATNEVKGGVQQRDNPKLEPNFPSPKPMYAWDSEVNIMIDYRTDRTWAAIKLEFDNDMGVRSGTVNSIKLEKAYLGGRIINADTFTTDAEIGRRYLYNVFESKIEFSSLYDGALVRLNKAFPGIGDYYLSMGGFLINDLTNHYGLVAETGALRIANVGLNIKYSIIDWYRPGGENMDTQTAPQTALSQQRFKFLVSQLIASYQFYPEWIGKRLVKFYGGGLTNHFAEGVEQTGGKRVGGVVVPAGTVVDGVVLEDSIVVGGVVHGGKRENWGWYAGVSIGVAKKAGDWALDANYQWAQAQVVPDFDVLGIGRGNTSKVGLYTTNVDGSGVATKRENAGGNCNYKGFEIEALYALTNNLIIQQNYKMSWTLDKNIGPNQTYKQYEIEFIYAF